VSLSTPRSRRWTREYALTVFADFDNSALSLADFARTRGFDIQRLRWWSHQLGRQDKPRIVELVAKDQPPQLLQTTHAAALRIHCPSGHLVELNQPLPQPLLVDLFRALQEATC